MKKVADHPLFDQVIADLKLKNDAALCVTLNLQPSLVSRMRNGYLPISDGVRVAIMRRCRWSLKRVDQLAPPAEQEAE